MTQTSPDEIQIVPMDDLVKLKVVTGDIYSEEWSYEIRGDLSYLKAEQITWRGTNKLLFICVPSNKAKNKKRQPVLMTLSELPEREKIIASAKMLILIVDGKSIPLSPRIVKEAPKLSGDLYIEWAILLTPKLIAALKFADRLGSGISPGPPEEFAGVAGVHLGNGRQKLSTFLDNCL